MNTNTTRFRHLRRNFGLLYLDYLTFGMGITLVSSATVVPDFVRRLTTSDVLIGFSGSLYSFTWLLPQLYFAQIISRSARRKPFMSRYVIPFRLTMPIMAAVVAATSPGNQNGILAAFLAGYAIFALGDGLITLVWADLLGSSLPARWRSTLFGTAQFGVAIGALIMRELVRHILGPAGPAFPQNYAFLFVIAGALFQIGAVALTLTVEEETDTPPERGPAMREYLPYLGNVLRADAEFRHFALTRILLDLAGMAIPFFVVFGAQDLKLDSATLVGDSILLNTFGNATASILMGWLSRRSGSRAVIMVASMAKILSPTLALSSVALGQSALYAAFYLLGFVNAGMGLGYFDWVITHAPPDRRPIYVGLTNTISAISNLSPLLGGAILSLTSFPALFGGAILMGLLGLRSALTLAEPRKKQAEAGNPLP